MSFQAQSGNKTAPLAVTMLNILYTDVLTQQRNIFDWITGPENWK